MLDKNGDTGGVTLLVEVVNLLPTPDFRVKPRQPVALTPILFEDLSVDEDGDVVAWEWCFGDGGRSSERSPA